MFRFMLLLPLVALFARGQDAESLSHGDEAASPQVSYEASRDGLVVRQYQLGCLSQLSYLLASDGVAVVVDPTRDVEHYLRDAKALGATIRFVALTHTNADFVAGHTKLAHSAGAEILIAAASGSAFPHRAIKDGERVAFGGSSLEFVATPGHTLDSMTILVRAGPAAEPTYALTGDTLFIGSIGRPDLASGQMSPMALADKAFDSMQRLKRLPDATIVLPGHGAGSLCGAHLSPETTSTIGRERIENEYLRIASRSAFVARDVSDLPIAPRYFAYNVALNRKGPPLVEPTDKAPPALSAAELAQAVANGAWVIDVRDGRAYAAAHLEGSINIAVRGRLDTWTGIVVPFTAPMILVGSEGETRESAFRFKRIGLDQVLGRLDGGLDAARQAGMTIRSTELVAPKALADLIAAGTEPIIVDVRTTAEVAEMRLGDYAHIDVADWERFALVLDRDRPVLFVCNSAYRSLLAAGLAERQGFKHVLGLDGGLDAWLQAGLPVYGTAPVCAGPVCPPGAAVASPTSAAGPPQVSGGELSLPEPIEPTALAALLLDQPQSYAVIDIRPAWQFDEYHVPGALNVVPAEVAARIAALPRGRRIVIVDRDGTLAYAVAGAVSAQIGPAAPTMRVLAGGTARFWRDVETTGSAPAAHTTPPSGAAPGAGSAPAAPTTPAPKKRSAGC